VNDLSAAVGCLSAFSSKILRFEIPSVGWETRALCSGSAWEERLVWEVDRYFRGGVVKKDGVNRGTAALFFLPTPPLPASADGSYMISPP